MKNLLYLGIILMLASCGSNESESAASNELESAASNESESAASNESESAASNESESAASNESTVNYNGREVSTVKIGNLEVMTEDLGEEGDEFQEPMLLMDWYEAMEACADLGDGWRLPTKDELNVLYENKDKIGFFRSRNGYWSSTEEGEHYAWAQDFDGGYQGRIQNYGGMCYVRAVRAF